VSAPCGSQEPVDVGRTAYHCRLAAGHQGDHSAEGRQWPLETSEARPGRPAGIVDWARIDQASRLWGMQGWLESLADELRPVVREDLVARIERWAEVAGRTAREIDAAEIGS
jgi:hypothetical protein